MLKKILTVIANFQIINLPSFICLSYVSTVYYKICQLVDNGRFFSKYKWGNTSLAPELSRRIISISKLALE